jgi:hypothetical protein
VSAAGAAGAARRLRVPRPVGRGGDGGTAGRAVGPALAGLCTLVATAAAGAAPPPPAPPVIEIRDEGFVPPTLRVPEGTIVVFQSRGSRPHWPASNLHPTHQVYPEFDAKRGLEPGERWAFRFDRPGEWGFHDHLAPELGGRIVVTPGPGFHPMARMRRGWEGSRERAREAWGLAVLTAGRLYYRVFPGKLEGTVARLDARRIAADEDALAYWVALVGPARLIAKLLRDSAGGSAFDCHQAAHQIGRAAYRRQGGAVFREGDSSCHAGFYHGAMEAFLADRGTADLADDIDRLCRGFGTRFEAFQCFHGVGHGVMAHEGYDLSRALETCGRLRTGLAQGACFEGAFMENVVSALGFGAERNHRSPWLSRDPHFPCNAIAPDDRLQFHCYQMQTSWMLALYDYDFAKVAEECRGLARQLPRVCYRSLGRDIAGITHRRPAAIVALCGGLPRPAESFDPCLGGALEVIVDFWGEALRGQASELCRLASDPSKQLCYAVLAGRLGDLYAREEDRALACSSFEPAYRSLCERSPG